MTATRGFDADYETITTDVGLLDRSDRGKLALSGADAKDFLQGQVSQDVAALSSGQGCYAVFLTPKGKMLGDLRILDTGAELLLDTERVALQALFNMIRRYSVGYEVALHKRTLESGMLSLIGPLADELVTRVGASLGPEEHDHLELTLGGAATRAVRTDVGADVLCPAGALPAVREALLEAGAVEIAEPAAEVLRVERGWPRYGVDLDDSVIPQEAQLNERAVSFTKGCYVGQETVARLFYRGKPNRELRGLSSAEPLEIGAELSLDGRTVGTVTSTAQSPRFGHIALSLVRREAPPGAVVQTTRGLDAVVSELPFG